MIELTALLSVAKLSFFISSAAFNTASRFSLLALALSEVIGVDPPLMLLDPAGVDEPVVPPFALAFAAFSARRFCLDAEGAMMCFWLLCVDDRVESASSIGRRL